MKLKTFVIPFIIFYCISSDAYAKTDEKLINDILAHYTHAPRVVTCRQNSVLVTLYINKPSRWFVVHTLQKTASEENQSLKIIYLKFFIPHQYYLALIKGQWRKPESFTLEEKQYWEQVVGNKERTEGIKICYDKLMKEIF